MKYLGKIINGPYEKNPQLDWFLKQVEKAGYVEVKGKINPCLALHGKGPDGKRCKECALLYRHGNQGRYLKCELRTFTRGPGSDHRANWPACGKFQPKEAK